MFATVRWVESVASVRIAATERLVGGMSSEVYRCSTAAGVSFVVRHITDRAWLEREPALIDHEARALELLADSPVSAPLLVATDPPTGRLLMTHMSGSLVTTSIELANRLGAIAEAAANIAAVPLPDDHGLEPWRSWAPTDLTPPTWGTTQLWQRAIDAYRSGEPAASEPVLLHRDLHPLNLLWEGDRVSAVVDWVNACVGPAHAELGHCRWNLAVLVGLDAADEFLDRYLAVTAARRSDYDRWWDLAPLMSFVTGPLGLSGWHAVGRKDLTSERVILATEAFLESVLAAG